MFVVEETNLSFAWGKLFLALMQAGTGELSPTLVTIRSSRELQQLNEVRMALDNELAGRDLSCHMVANTVFPASLRKPGEPASNFYRRYHSLESRIRACHPANRYGTYFERMVDYANGGQPGGGINQLHHVVQTFASGNHRRSALQVAIFDPRQDHTHQRQRGFPCLHQLGLGFVEKGLSLTAFFATQYVFERAYGNWVGLWELGEHLAEEMGMELKQLNVIAGVAMLGHATKRDLRYLEGEVEKALVAPRQLTPRELRV